MFHVLPLKVSVSKSAALLRRSWHFGAESQGVTVQMVDEISEDFQDQNPPTTNQGGVSTSSQLSVGLDYLTVSLPGVLNSKEVVRAMGAVFKAKVDSIVYEKGYEGWLCCAGYGRLLIRQYRDKAEADVLMRLPGRALEWIRFENVVSETDSICTDADICKFFLERDFHATRIDLAADNSDREVSPQLVERHLKSKQFTCKARKAGITNSWELGAEPWESSTIYLGGRSSTRLLRVYDKQAEVFQKTGRKIPHLTRFEIENKYQAAPRVMNLVAEHGAALVIGLLKGWVDFKDPSDDATRVERRRSAEWWQRMVNSAEPIQLGLTRGIATPEKSIKWVKRQVAKTLYLMKEFDLEHEIAHAISEKKFKVKKAELAKWDYFVRSRKELETEGNDTETEGAKE